MGLDAWLFSLPRQAEINVDFHLDEDEEPTEIGYWRKNHYLQIYMAERYTEKGGQSIIFNCNRVVLDEDDLDDLEAYLQETDYAESDVGWTISGDDANLDYDLGIIKTARTEIAKGHTVYYDSWW